MSQDNNRRWKRLRRFCQDLRQQFLSGSRLRRSGRRDDVIPISPYRVMTRDGHVLEIDQRCDKCRESFKV